MRERVDRDDTVVSPSRAKAAQKAIVAWFDRARRDLPWRRTKDPYAVWVSEIMLQQTRVETVIPYFERFMGRFPDVEELARADIADVLLAWSGLGYYRRARGLHAAAREVVSRYGAKFPRTTDELRTLPGVGEYTAGAVASIAFGERAPAIDGNVMRVVGRYIGLRADVGSTEAKRAVRAACEALVPPVRPGDFNEALMELGATVCSPTSPDCPSCPWRRSCRGVELGLDAVAGGPKKRAAVPRVKLIAAIVEREGAVLLARRPLDGLFGGLGEPPLAEGPLPRARTTFARAGIELHGKPGPRSVEHVLTHKVLEVKLATARADAPQSLAPYTDLAYVPRSQLQATPMSTLARRLVRVSFADA
ncbi:MAG: A/G-specific adenine glycosylase [Polyangiaceae bacterium]|nr:A/G-specific adenine glycosylase [Polyangiaceae bacterium]